MLHALTGKELSFKELFKLMKDIKSNKTDLSSSSKYNNISINININNNEVQSPGEESPKFKVNATHSILNSNNSALYSHPDQSSRKESMTTSRSSLSNENNKKIKLIMKNLKDKLTRDGLLILMEMVKETQRNQKFNSFWKIHQIVNFKNAVHLRIRDHISKKSYIPRFMKLIYQ
jgi:hypothetical protein